MNAIDTFKKFLVALPPDDPKGPVTLAMLELAESANSVPIYRQVMGTWIRCFGHNPNLGKLFHEILAELNQKELVAQTGVELLSYAMNEDGGSDGTKEETLG